ncbi:leukocyte receptor cluster lrc member 1 [Anaeramoeba flamelloides]|uniref:Leukocyte receptor cluster lrc member 1 n=1 Tax=Anaeramoeba flamelloides TaxID=1746091 RepID=A0ABQ8XU83_9EUKA|nr:leukocyte receptor cluster lrc member 1 [Anaeramoeba flamelloides]
MTLQILPHKSWNVYNRKNIEKVESDKKKHQKEIEEKKKQDENRQREERYRSLLNQKNNEKNDVKPQDQHPNFFKKQMKNQSFEKNPERELEEKEELDALKNRFTNYLGKSSVEFNDKKPWFYNLEALEMDKDMLEREDRIKKNSDPLKLIESSVAKKKEIEKNRLENFSLMEYQTFFGTPKQPINEIDLTGLSEQLSKNKREKRGKEEKKHKHKHKEKSKSKKRKKEKKKNKHKHRDKHKDKGKSKGKSKSKSKSRHKKKTKMKSEKKSIEELRKERMDREQNEYLRAQRLIIDEKIKQRAFANKIRKNNNYTPFQNQNSFRK